MLGFLVSWDIGVRTYLLIPRWETNQLGFHKWCLTPIYYLPIHNGSHEPWNKHAENILNSKLDKLINIYCSIDNVPGHVLIKSVKNVETKLNADIRTWKVIRR